MSATIEQPKVGDRVRIVIEGEWKHRDGYHGGTVRGEPGEVVSLEVLRIPEPTWRPGDVVRHKDGTVLFKVRGDRWTSSLSADIDFSARDVTGWWQRGSLTVLVKDGELQP